MDHEWRDISVPLDADTVVWPDDGPLRHDVLSTVEEDGARVSRVDMSVHTGTHVDAPAHFEATGLTIDSMPIDAMMGPCVVIDIPDVQKIGPEDLGRFELVDAERVLIRTDNSKRGILAHHDFHDDFSHLTADGARYLAQRRIRCVGIDYLSIGNGEDNDETHRILMESGVWIIEGLDLRGVDPGEYELLCLPLRMTGLEAAPARALLGKRKSGDETPDFIEDAVEFSTKVG